MPASQSYRLCGPEGSFDSLSRAHAYFADHRSKNGVSEDDEAKFNKYSFMVLTNTRFNQETSSESPVVSQLVRQFKDSKSAI